MITTSKTWERNWLAKCGQIEKLAPTKKAAVDAVKDALVMLATHYTDRAYFWSPDGKTCLVVRFAHGWGYDIIGPDRRGSSSVGCGDSFAEACDFAKRHAESYTE